MRIIVTILWVIVIYLLAVISHQTDLHGVLISLGKQISLNKNLLNSTQVFKTRIIKEGNFNETLGILITGGHGAKKSTELFLLKTGKTCSLASLPRERRFHTLDTLDNTGAAVLCGGEEEAAMSSCIHFSPTSGLGVWTNYFNTLQKRHSHTSWVSGEGLLLVAGSGSHKKSPSSTSFTSEFINGAINFTLPQKYSQACAIPDQSSFFLTGGMFTAKVVARFNLEGHIENLPDLTQGRRLHGCGFYNRGSTKVLVVAGGLYRDMLLMASTETFMLGSLAPAWTSGKPLAVAMAYMASTSLDNAVVMIGGWDGSKDRLEIMFYNGNWTEEGLLQNARSGAAATKMYNTGLLDIRQCK